MNELYLRNKKLIDNLLLVSIMVISVYVIINYLFTFIAPFVIGYILSLIFNPIVKFLNKRLKFPRWLGTLVSIGLLLMFFSIVIVGIFNRIADEFSLFSDNLPEYIELLKSAFDNLAVKYDDLLLVMPSSVKTLIDSSSETFWSLIPQFFKSASSGSFNLVVAIPSFFMIVIISLVSSFFFTKDKYKIETAIMSIMPKSINRNINLFKENLLGALTGYIKAQLTLMCFTFIISTIGLVALRYPYSLLLSIIISIIDALPLFGSGFILWPGAALLLLSGDTATGVGFIIIYLMVILMRQVMEPNILGTQIGLHPLITLFAMYIGLKIFGVLGMIIGPLLAVMINAVLTLKNTMDKDLPI